MNIARLKNSRAFTLIELIVVIVVLGILAALVAFAYQSFINDSRAEAAEKTGSQVSTTLHANAVTAQDAAATKFTDTASLVTALTEDLKDANGVPPGTYVDADTPATGWAIGPVSGGKFTLYNQDTDCSVEITLGTTVGEKNTVDEGVCS